MFFFLARFARIYALRLYYAFTAPLVKPLTIYLLRKKNIITAGNA